MGHDRPSCNMTDFMKRDPTSTPVKSRLFRNKPPALAAIPFQFMTIFFIVQKLIPKYPLILRLPCNRILPLKAIPQYDAVFSPRKLIR
jgi:hypothetical protein